MSLRIFHTADLHIGMKFSRGDYDPSVREKLVEARFDTLKRMVELSNAESCHLFMIAGDLFNSHTVAKRDVLRVAHILKDCDGQVAILPGNHDYAQPEGEGVWSTIKENLGENCLLLQQRSPYKLSLGDHTVALYPGPCRSKHSSANAIGWISGRRKKQTADYHIGAAHGSLEGISPDFDKEYYPMTEVELESAGLDLWLMGHTHQRIPTKNSGKGGGIFFPSTPEPDGFDCDHEGYAWRFDLDGQEIRYRAVQTGKFRFHTLSENLQSEQDLEALENRVQKLSKTTDLLKLKVSGRIPRETFESRSGVWRRFEKNVLHVEVYDRDLYERITVDDIDREFTAGSFPHELLTELADEKEDPLALQMAYDIIRELRS